MVIASKFGGSSLADAAQIRKAAAIIQQDASRRYIVVSAPGKRFPEDVKVTDLLLRCYDAAAAGGDFSESFAALERRFREILRELNLDLDLSADLRRIRSRLATDPHRAYIASRGEFLCARILSAYLGYPFLDAADCIFFRKDGVFDPTRTYPLLISKLRLLPRAVIPGFYGSLPDGSIATFSRGGSDVTGAIVAAAAGASVYENWTDVPGVLAVDPSLVPDARPIPFLTYRELRQLARSGAQVLHEDAVFPAKSAGIPIVIRSTDDPAAPGTRISDLPAQDGAALVGIAGRSGFTAVTLEKDGMGADSGFFLSALSVLREYGVPLFHSPMGADVLTLVVPAQALAPRREALLRALSDETGCDRIRLRQGLALLTVTGQDRGRDMAAPVLAVLSRLGLTPEFVDSGRDAGLALALPEDSCPAAIRGLYDALCR